MNQTLRYSKLEKSYNQYIISNENNEIFFLNKDGLSQLQHKNILPQLLTKLKNKKIIYNLNYNLIEDSSINLNSYSKLASLTLEKSMKINIKKIRKLINTIFSKKGDIDEYFSTKNFEIYIIIIKTKKYVLKIGNIKAKEIILKDQSIRNQLYNIINTPKIISLGEIEKYYYSLEEHIGKTQDKISNTLIYKELVKMHSIPFKYYGDYFGSKQQRFATWYEYLKQLCESLRNNLFSYEYTTLIQILEELKFDFEKVSPSLLHLDLHKDNILFKKNQIYFIDFELSIIGDKVLDYVVLYFFTKDDSHIKKKYKKKIIEFYLFLITIIYSPNNINKLDFLKKYYKKYSIKEIHKQTTWNLSNQIKARIKHEKSIHLYLNSQIIKEIEFFTEYKIKVKFYILDKLDILSNKILSSKLKSLTNKKISLFNFEERILTTFDTKLLRKCLSFTENNIKLNSLKSNSINRLKDILSNNLSKNYQSCNDLLKIIDYFPSSKIYFPKEKLSDDRIQFVFTLSNKSQKTYLVKYLKKYFNNKRIINLFEEYSKVIQSKICIGFSYKNKIIIRKSIYFDLENTNIHFLVKKFSLQISKKYLDRNPYIIGIDFYEKSVEYKLYFYHKNKEYLKKILPGFTGKRYEETLKFKIDSKKYYTRKIGIFTKDLTHIEKKYLKDRNYLHKDNMFISFYLDEFGNISEIKRYNQSYILEEF